MEDLSRLSLRELLTLARERLGSAASGLKTRDEILSALTPVSLSPAGERVGERAHEISSEPVREEPVTRDFFKRR